MPRTITLTVTRADIHHVDWHMDAGALSDDVLENKATEVMVREIDRVLQSPDPGGGYNVGTGYGKTPEESSQNFQIDHDIRRAGTASGEAGKS